ncbi:hypothetical protein HDU67_006561, partial [Dinochytrium kinnereticum]
MVHAEEVRRPQLTPNPRPLNPSTPQPPPHFLGPFRMRQKPAEPYVWRGGGMEKDDAVGGERKGKRPFMEGLGGRLVAETVRRAMVGPSRGDGGRRGLDGDDDLGPTERIGKRPGMMVRASTSYHSPPNLGDRGGKGKEVERKEDDLDGTDVDDDLAPTMKMDDFSERMQR